MRIIIIIAFTFAYFHSGAQSYLGFDSTQLMCLEQGIYMEREITMDEYGNTYLLGVFKFITGIGVDNIHTNSNSLHVLSRAVYLIKLNQKKEYVWIKKMAESDSLTVIRVSNSRNGALELALSYRRTLYLNNDSILNVGLNDAIYLQIDTSGEITSKKVIASSCHELIYAHCQTEDQSTYLVGAFSQDSNNTINNCPTYFDSIFINQSKQSFLSKLNVNNQFEWVKPMDIASPVDIVEYKNSIYLLGLCTVGDSLFTVPLVFPTNYDSKGVLAKMDTSGNVIWARKFGTQNQQFDVLSIKKVIVEGKYVYFMGGAFSNNQNQFVFEGGPTLSGYDQTDCFIACYDTLGNFKWNTILDSYGSEYLTQLESDTLGNVYGVGKLNYTMRFDTDTLFTRGGDDVLVCSYDSSGNFRWAISGGGIGTDIGNGIIKDANGKLFIVGGTTSPDLFMGNDTVFNGLSQSRSFITSIDSLPILWPNSISAMVKENMQLKIQPNPAGDFVRVSVNQRGVKGKLQVYDLSGRPILVREILEQVTLNVSEWNSGIYLFNYLSNDGKREIQKLIIHH